MVEDDLLREAFSHTLDEMNIPNIAISLQKCNFKKIQKAHNSIHEFALIPLCFIHTHKDFQIKSAFLVYHYESFEQAHRSFLEALSGYYNAAYTLLRNTLELILKGAFWECIAHKKYRDSASIIKKIGTKIGKSKISLVEWINELIRQKPSTEGELEQTSAGIYDKISPLFNDKKLRKVIPTPKYIFEQLKEWNVFDPIQNPIDYVYGSYSKLSADVHVEPDRTNIGRRLLAKNVLFKTEVLPDELNKFVDVLHRVMDIGIVIELNILEDIMNKKSVKLLEARSGVITGLGLIYASDKLEYLLEREG